MTQAATQKTYHHGNLRSALIAAGTEVLEESGPGDLSLRGLARRVGVSEAAPARHFSGKDDLLAAIAAEGFRVLAKTRVAILEQKLDTRETVRTMMTAYVDFALAHPGLFALMVGPRLLAVSASRELTEALGISFGHFSAAVCALAGRHGWRETQFAAVVHAAWACEHGLATLLISRRAPNAAYPIDVAEMVQSACTILLSGIAMGPSSAPTGVPASEPV